MNRYRRIGGFYRTCPYCGAALDPGEKCDCGERPAAQKRNYRHERRASMKPNSTPPAAYHGKEWSVTV